MQMIMTLQKIIRPLLRGRTRALSRVSARVHTLWTRSKHTLPGGGGGRALRGSTRDACDPRLLFGWMCMKDAPFLKKLRADSFPLGDRHNYSLHKLNCHGQGHVSKECGGKTGTRTKRRSVAFIRLLPPRHANAMRVLVRKCKVNVPSNHGEKGGGKGTTILFLSCF
ncbi:hypothetical protein BC940DRAFT_180477 [Gongronella butleri]|nr:hypothetical protein BC940DRAFT_180477 [Gongronella butleri]